MCPLGVISTKPELDKYKVDGLKAVEFAKVIARRVPENLNCLSDKTVASFMEVLPENERDLSVIYIFPTDGEAKQNRWREYYMVATQYIAVDKYFNPIDVNKFIKVMGKIIVDK